VDLSTFETILLVNDVQSSDYGRYECEARNEKGFATASITLDVTSLPDPPLSLTVLNVTHDAVTLTWVPGFDGGMSSSFRIRYKPIDSSEYLYHLMSLVDHNMPYANKFSCYQVRKDVTTGNHSKNISIYISNLKIKFKSLPFFTWDITDYIRC